MLPSPQEQMTKLNTSPFKVPTRMDTKALKKKTKRPMKRPMKKQQQKLSPVKREKRDMSRLMADIQPFVKKSEVLFGQEQEIWFETTDLVANATK